MQFATIELLEQTSGTVHNPAYFDAKLAAANEGDPHGDYHLHFRDIASRTTLQQVIVPAGCYPNASVYDNVGIVLFDANINGEDTRIMMPKAFVTIRK